MPGPISRMIGRPPSARSRSSAVGRSTTPSTTRWPATRSAADVLAVGRDEVADADEDRVAPAPAGNDVEAAGHDVDAVVARAAVDRVVAEVAEDLVVARAAGDRVVAAVARDAVVAL